MEPPHGSSRASTESSEQYDDHQHLPSRGLTINDNSTYTTYGRTHEIRRYELLSAEIMEDEKYKGGLTTRPQLFSDIPTKIDHKQTHAIRLRKNLSPTQINLLRSFHESWGCLVMDVLLNLTSPSSPSEPSLVTAVLDYNQWAWKNAFFLTTSHYLPWTSVAAWMTDNPGLCGLHQYRLAWASTCCGRPPAFERLSVYDHFNLDEIIQNTMVLPLPPASHDGQKIDFVAQLGSALDQIPNGYLHTLFLPQTISQIFKYMGFTPCLLLQPFFERFRGPRSDDSIIDWISLDPVGSICPIGRLSVIPRGLLPDIVSAQLHRRLAELIESYNPPRDDCFELNLAQVCQNHVMTNAYTPEQLTEVLSHLGETRKLMDRYHSNHHAPIFFRNLISGMKSHPFVISRCREVELSCLAQQDDAMRLLVGVIDESLLHFQYRYELIRDRSSKEPTYAIQNQVHSRGIIHDQNPDHHDQNHIDRFEDQSGHDNAEAPKMPRMTLQQWKLKSYSPFKEYLKSFEVVREFNLCKNCLAYNRAGPVFHITHATEDCGYIPIWDALKNCGPKDVDMDLTPPHPPRKQAISDLEYARRLWFEKARRPYGQLLSMADAMPENMCRNCLFLFRGDKQGRSAAHHTDQCRHVPLFYALFDKAKYLSVRDKYPRRWLSKSGQPTTG